MSSFWGNKLGTTAPPPPQPVINPNYLPRGMGNTDQSRQRAVNDYASRMPGQYQAPQAPPPAAPLQGSQWQQNTTDPTRVAEVLPIWQWQGKEGAAETARIGNCPSCGSTNFFSRSSGTVINTNSGTAASPAPECFECGYPRNQGIIAGTASTSDPAMAARQGAAPSAPLGSIARLSNA
jgi:hypothetical protein